MATLDLTYEELRRRIGRYLGCSGDPDNWTANQTSDVDDALRSGLRRFYYPPSGHIWSFLKQLHTITTVASTRSYNLAANFASLTDTFSYAPNVKQPPLESIDEEVLRQLYAGAEQTGPPKYFTIRTKPIGDGNRTQHEVLFYPVPDKEYVLTYRYLVEPMALSLSNLYPLGGAIHAETILESCLFSAEIILNSESAQTRGGYIHQPHFERHLAASIELDQRN